MALKCENKDMKVVLKTFKVMEDFISTHNWFTELEKIKEEAYRLDDFLERYQDEEWFPVTWSDVINDLEEGGTYVEDLEEEVGEDAAVDNAQQSLGEAISDMEEVCK